MELRIAAETGEEGGLNKGVARTGAVEAEEALEAFALAEGSEADAGLLLEEAAEAGGAEAGAVGEGVEADGAVGAGEEAGSLGDGGVDVGARDGFAGELVGLPRGDERVIEGGVDEREIFADGTFVDVVEEVDVAGIDLAAEDVAGIAGAEDAAVAGTGAAPDEPGLEDDDPHGEIVGPINEDVFLSGEEPNHGTGKERDAAVAEEVGGFAGEDEVDLEFLVMVGGDGAELAVGEEGEALDAGADLELFLHGDKK